MEKGLFFKLCEGSCVKGEQMFGVLKTLRGGGGGGAWAGPGWSFDCHQAELGVQLLLPSGNTGLLVLLCYCCAWQLLSLLSRCMRSVVIITDGGWGAYLQITAMAVQHFPGRSLGTFFIHFFFFNYLRPLCYLVLDVPCIKDRRWAPKVIRQKCFWSWHKLLEEDWFGNFQEPCNQYEICLKHRVHSLKRDLGYVDWVGWGY